MTNEAQTWWRQHALQIEIDPVLGVVSVIGPPVAEPPSWVRWGVERIDPPDGEPEWSICRYVSEDDLLPGQREEAVAGFNARTNPQDLEGVLAQFVSEAQAWAIVSALVADVEQRR